MKLLIKPKELLLFLTFIFLINMNVKSQENNYNIEILYKNPEQNESSQKDLICSKDSIPIFFENGFENDFLEVFVNGEILLTEEISTNNSTNLAKNLYLANYKLTKNIGIRINKGRLVYIETNNQCCYIGIRFNNREKLSVVFYNSLPLFY